MSQLYLWHFVTTKNIPLEYLLAALIVAAMVITFASFLSWSSFGVNGRWGFSSSLDDLLLHGLVKLRGPPPSSGPPAHQTPAADLPSAAVADAVTGGNTDECGKFFVTVIWRGKKEEKQEKQKQISKNCCPINYGKLIIRLISALFLCLWFFSAGLCLINFCNHTNEIGPATLRGE